MVGDDGSLVGDDGEPKESHRLRNLRERRLAKRKAFTVGDYEFEGEEKEIAMNCLRNQILKGLFGLAVGLFVGKRYGWDYCLSYSADQILSAVKYSAAFERSSLGPRAAKWSSILGEVFWL